MKTKGNLGKAKLIVLFVCLMCFGKSIFAQNFDFYTEQIKTGSAEAKRSVLFQIRNLQTSEASRIAVPALQDSNEIVRATAAYSVIYLQPDEAVKVLLPNLKDKSPLVRKETAYALGKVKNSNALANLLEILERDKALEVRMASALALGEIGDVSAVESLLKILQRKPKEEEDFFRRAAARSIGQIAQFQQINSNYTVTPESLLPEKYDIFVNLKYSNLAERSPVFKKSVNILLSVLQNQNESDDVRRESAFALGTIGDQSAIKSLQNNLAAKDYYLAEICKEGLQKIQQN